MSGELLSNCHYIARLLNKEKIVSDTTPLNQIKDSNGLIQLTGLEFNIQNKEVFRNARPAIKNLRIILDINYVENPHYNYSDMNGQIPFDSYDFSLLFIGINDDKVSRMSIHLDMEKSSMPNVLHPMFHMTYGGERIKDMELGEMLLLSSPRISFPPMDIILGIDFVLSNFLEKESYKNKIINEPQYRTPLRNAQEKYWMPYYVPIANNWCRNKCNTLKKIPSNIIVSYVPTLVS